jgi:AraC-like DNA-binding protein
MRKFSRHINWRNLIFERDDYTCYICNKRFNKKQLEVDHIIPVSKGGDNSFNNLKTACINCNRSKYNSVDNIKTVDTPTFYTIKEVASLTDKSERTIQRIIKKLKGTSTYSMYVRKSNKSTRGFEVNKNLLIKLGYLNNKQKHISLNDKLIELLIEQLKSKDEQINKIFNLLQIKEKI